MADRPRGRERRVTGSGKGVAKRGSGTGTGPVGSGSFKPGKARTSSHGGSSGGGNYSGGTTRGSSGSLGIIPLIIIVGIAYFVISKTGILSGTSSNTGSSTGSGLGTLVSLLGSDSLSSTLSSVSGTSTSWGDNRNTGVIDTSVSSEARAKYTTIKGDGSDVYTIMVYMCGTDLESKSGMATRDLNEMLQALISDKVNLIVYTGGCSAWKNSTVSSSTNQIYQIYNGEMKLLESDMGSKAMTDPATLTEFIKYGASNFPANRYALIFWDHGGGSISGYGYDEKYKTSGSMDISEISQALSAGGIKYDFIGFDACLMATLETGLMAADYADYLIASEETEPGIGWYYTDWLTELSSNTSMSTVELGKNIVDDFVSKCSESCSGQKATLSVVDLAELSQTVPDDLKTFATSTKSLITDGSYETVSTARSNTREFSTSSKIDQIDLVDFAQNLGTDDATTLANTLLGAVKYNNTSSNITNAYGISIYFPYNRTSYVSKSVEYNNAVGIDSSYSECIREFASLETSAQSSLGSAGSLLSMLGGSTSSSSYSTSSASSLLSAVSSISDFSSLLGDTSSMDSILGDRAISAEDIANYISENQLDASKLTWNQASGGEYYISIDEDQWALIHSVDLCMYYDDGTGYLDLGQDNRFSIDTNGNLISEDDGAWISINDQPVAYYHTDTTDDGDNYTITGYVPALLNGERVKLILIFDNDNPYGYIAGTQMWYDGDTTETVSRGLIELETGDTLDFLCDYYDYDGNYSDTYYLGEQMTVTDEMTISDTYVGGSYLALYQLTDIYNVEYYTEVIP